MCCCLLSSCRGPRAAVGAVLWLPLWLPLVIIAPEAAAGAAVNGATLLMLQLPPAIAYLSLRRRLRKPPVTWCCCRRAAEVSPVISWYEALGEPRG